jgi:hypothetical protein
MYCLMIDNGAPPRETAKQDGDQRWPGIRARTHAPVAFTVELVQFGIASVNTLRRYLVMYTRCACSNDTLGRARR